MATAVSAIVQRAKYRADMENSNFVSPTEWITYVNNGYMDLYDILVSKFQDYFTISAEFTVASGSSLTLPDDFYKLRGVDRSNGGSDWFNIRPFNFEDRNRRGFYQRWRGIEPAIRYRVLNNSLIFSPADQAAGAYRLWYVPRATPVTAGDDTIDGVNDWEDYIVLYAAEKALAKEESDVSVIGAELGAIKTRIEIMAQNRDTGDSDSITDVTQAGYYEPLGW